jgi:hypothetical protein
MEENDEKTGFFNECWERFKKPWCGSFVAYFIFFIIILGGLGVLFSIFGTSTSPNEKIHSIASNLSTYFVALTIPAITDILMTFMSMKNKVSFIIYSVVFILISIALLYLSNTIETHYVLIPSIIGTILCWFIWVIANYDNEYLSDEAFDLFIKKETDEKHGGQWNAQQ